MNNKKQIDFIRKILNEFDENNIQYCILRNYEFLTGEPYPVESMDTVVAKSDLPKVDYILNKNGFIKRRQQFSLQHKAYFKLINLQKVSFDIQVGGVHWNDMCYLNEIILKNRVKKDFFYVPSDNDYFVMLLIHSILGKRYFKSKYQKILFSLDTDKEYVIGHLARIFNKSVAKNLYKLVKNNTFDKIKPYQLALYFILKKPQRIATSTALLLRWLHWKRFLRLSPLISFIGPDGAGKSTVVSELQKYLKNSGKNTVTVYMGRGRSHLLPITILGRKYKSREKKKDFNAGKQTSRKNRSLLYTFAAPLFTLDLFLRYYLTILPKRMKKNIVITDRYCSDITLMKHVPLSFKKILLKLFPKPTISVFLYNEPETLHQRRPEEPVKELERQMNIFNKFRYSLRLKTTNKEEDFGKVINFISSKLLREWY